MPDWLESAGVDCGIYGSIMGWVYKFHLPLLFMLSGYAEGIRPPQSFKREFLKSVVNLYIPCLFFSYLQAFLNLLVFSSSNFVNVHIPGMSHFLTIPFAGFFNYWFLCTLFLVKTVHFFFVCVVRNQYIHFAFWVIIFILAGFFGNFTPLVNIWDFSRGLYFFAGYVICTKNYVSRGKTPGFLCGTAFLSAGLLILFAVHSDGAARFFVNAAGASCVIFSLLILFYALNVSNKFLSFCGLYSMVIYCIHNYAAMIFRISYKLGGFSSYGLVVLPCIVCFAMALFVPLGVVWLYKNVKCLRWIEYIFYPGKLIRI